MNETEMFERYRILSTYEGEDFKKKLDETLSDIPKEKKDDFLLLARDRNIQDSKKCLEQSKLLREKRFQILEGKEEN